jgi:hypothetical protein
MTKIYKSINSGKYFIHIEDIGNGMALFVSPKGRLMPIKTKSFEKETMEGKTDNLFNRRLITAEQKERREKYYLNKIEELKRKKENELDRMKKLEHRAYHEAGHAVIFFAMGISIEKVTIRCRYDKARETPLGGETVIDRSSEYVGFALKYPAFAEIIGTYASYYSEKKKFKLKNNRELLKLKDGSKLDQETVNSLLNPVGKNLAKVTKNILKKTSAILLDFPIIWKSVERVALQLLDQSEITGEQLEKIMAAECSAVESNVKSLRLFIKIFIEDTLGLDNSTEVSKE